MSCAAAIRPDGLAQRRSCAQSLVARRGCRLCTRTVLVPEVVLGSRIQDATLRSASPVVLQGDAPFGQLRDVVNTHGTTSLSLHQKGTAASSTRTPN